MNSQGYWLYRWLDENGITDSSDLKSALDSRKILSAMQEHARNWKPSILSDHSECNLVAGSGLGQYNGLTCLTPACQAERINVLFRHAWHYFDRIFFPDATGDLLRSTEQLPPEQRMGQLGSHIETAMYFRQIGAESLVEFYPESLLRNAELEVDDAEKWSEIWNDLEAIFLSHPQKFSSRKESGTMYKAWYADDELRYNPVIDLDMSAVPKQSRNRLLRDVLAKNMAGRHRKAFQRDMIAAAALKGSVGSTIWSHEYALARITKEANEAEIFFRMEFPSLENVAIADLISVRTQERESFVACRDALRKAVREIAKDNSKAPRAIANEVISDVVSPQIARLQQKLESARSVLLKKSAVAISIAAVSTWCGVHFGAGMATSLGAGTLAGFASGFKDAASKYSEDRREIELSDISFMWKALKCVS